MARVSMKKEDFEKLVEEALSGLPRKFKKLIENLVVMVEEEAPLEAYRQTGSSPFSRILGTYHGVPFKHRGPYYGNIPPDVITIYQKPIEEICSTEKEIRDEVRKVVIHEVGHYFGFSDNELREIEEENWRKH
jgi:predicted Zn-dependent protease with MMP-like domain